MHTGLKPVVPIISPGVSGMKLWPAEKVHLDCMSGGSPSHLGLVLSGTPIRKGRSSWRSLGSGAFRRKASQCGTSIQGTLSPLHQTSVTGMVLLRIKYSCISRCKRRGLKRRKLNGFSPLQMTSISKGKDDGKRKLAKSLSEKPIKQNVSGITLSTVTLSFYAPGAKILSERQ